MKSNEAERPSDYLELVHAVLVDASTKCVADVYDLRDFETLKSRVRHEGISFLTITLPKFCQDFERSLAAGFIDSTAFARFKRIKEATMPEFLQGMVSQVFDRRTGRIYDKTKSPDGDSAASDVSTVIECIRQLCLTYKKVEISCTPERVAVALANFATIERDFEAFSLQEEDMARFRAVSSVLWDNLVGPLRLSRCIPGHGPGATAEHVSGNQKYAWGRWHDRLEPYFPIIDNGYPIGVVNEKLVLEGVTIVLQEAEQPVRVVSVPKTLKSPRTIAIEPCCAQYVQQGIRSALYRAIESYWLTKGHVNFTDQSVNQQLAIESSMDGRLATIDLSDASDRVPHDLALIMFQVNSDFRDAIDTCRSRYAEMPDGTIIGPLRKFASMGSALCFPVEAMYFYTICVVALLKIQNLPVTPGNCFAVTRDVYVYGDDIVVPTAYATGVLDYLRKYNCKVNANKTFISGSFRESCGVDAYDGYQVTPVYIRQRRPENAQQASRIISWVASANAFYKKGFWRTASLMFNIIEGIVGPLPYVSENSEGLGRTSFLGYRSAERWNAKLQRFEIRALVPMPVYRTDRLEGYGALMKCLLRLEKSNPTIAPLEKVDSEGYPVPLQRGLVELDPEPTDPKHLERSAQHGAVTLKRRWIPSQI